MACSARTLVDSSVESDCLGDSAWRHLKRRMAPNVPCTIWFFVTCLAMLSSAEARCGRGQLPNYGDVDAVRYERSNCFGGKCPNYSVLFTKEGQCYYVGTANVGMIGTYRGACTSLTFNSVKSALRGYGFYDLNFDSGVLVLDAPHYLISVDRCGVTTRLDWPAYEDRKDILALLKRLDVITNNVPWRKTGNGLQPPFPARASIP
jgi:hypothetical protein